MQSNLNLQCVNVTSTSVSVTNVGLVPYNSMVLKAPEVAIVRFILVCSDVIICGILV